MPPEEAARINAPPDDDKPANDLSDAAVILHVNDDEATRYLTSRVLKKAGFVVLEAGTGEEALTKVQQRPDLVLLDVNLPDLSGLEVAKRIRTNPDLDGILVVHLSAVATGAKERTDGLEHGADGYLTYPIGPNELVANLRALIRLRKQAQLALTGRDEFLAVAAHELRTPLTAAQLNLQGLERLLARNGDKEIPAASVRRSTGPALRHLERLRALVEKLLDVSRFEDGRLHLDVEPFDLSEVVQDECQRVQAAASALGTTVDCEVQPQVVVYGDRLRLSQVVQNLVANALKYGEGSPVRIRLGSDGERAVLSVEDEGIGVAPEDQSRIFSRFARATHKESGVSLGLGLYIVQQIVTAHRGTVQVVSAPGEGSTFTVTVPLRNVRGY